MGFSPVSSLQLPHYCSLPSLQCPSQPFEFGSLIVAPCVELEARLLPFLLYLGVTCPWYPVVAKKGDDELVKYFLVSLITHSSPPHTRSRAHTQIWSKTVSSRELRKGVGDGFYLLTSQKSFLWDFPLLEPLSPGKVKVHVRVCFPSL